MEVWVTVRQFSLNLFSAIFLMVVLVLWLRSVEILVVCLWFFFNCFLKCLTEDSFIFFAYPSIILCTYLAFSL